MNYKTKSLTIALALLLGGVLGSSVAEARHADRLSCQPIATCSDATGIDAERCPPAHACVCVPSCPECDDCATEVCVPVELACHSACECPDGMGCIDGYCKETNAAIHCCDDENCPAGERCQTADGRFDICERECRTACDCDSGQGCFDGQCIDTDVPIYCCESDVCPTGQRCQSRNGTFGQCRAEPECRTACDCEPGLGCFNGQCLAGFAPVYCCEGDVCPTGNQCQHRDGRMDRCERSCTEHAWLCDENAGLECGEGRVCSCTASCPNCEDCGPNACVPPNSPTPYRCDADGGCARDGDKCICLSSCPECDDCALNVCVPACDDPMCEKRLRMSERRINRVIEKTRPCRADQECVRVETSTDCQGDCGAYVNAKYARRVQSFIDHVDERYCSTYQEDGCPYATPDCQLTVGACVRGLCTGVPPTEPNPLPFEPAQPLR